jgi:ubiquinone/menaquinone biosynthesis C-methylase UbiE
MLISHSHRFIFIHIGKTGGMSMREVLMPLTAEPEKFRMRRPPRLNGERPNPMYGVWETILLHAKARDGQKELGPGIWDAYYKFAFVRNPWDLQVSMYHFILREPEAPKHREVKALGSFEKFVDWVVETDEPYPKGITKLQSEMITDAEGRLLVDFVGRYETLEADFAHVAQAIGIDAELPHLNRSSHRDYRCYYTPHTKDLVAEHFRTDIESFGYCFDGIKTDTKVTAVGAVFEARNPEELAARYDEWAAKYEEDMGDPGGPKEAVEALSRYAGHTARILDAGCGTGVNGALLAARGYVDLEGLDLSAGMLREAKKKGCYKALRRESLGDRLSFASGTFDAVLVVGVFARAHAPSRSLYELVRVTKPGGFIVFTLRPEFHVATDFQSTMTELATAGRWRHVETSAPFDGRYREFPGINLQVWVYQVVANE